MKQFHPLKVLSKTAESRDALRIALDVPENLRDEFAFLPGQHLPIQIERDGRKLRRTYSICSPEGCWPLEIGVRVQPGGCVRRICGTGTAGGRYTRRDATHGTLPLTRGAQ